MIQFTFLLVLDTYYCMKKEKCYKCHTKQDSKRKVVILTNSVIDLEPVLRSPLIVHLVVPRLGKNPATIAANFEFSG